MQTAQREARKQPGPDKRPAAPRAGAAPAVNAVWRSVALGGGLLQRKCAACAAEDEEHVQRFFQAKLTVSAPTDPAEREAERVADHVMRMPDAGASSPRISEPARGASPQACAVCGGARSRAGDVSAAVARGTSGGGSPLDRATRTTMEARFSRDFSDVRVHTDADAARSAKSINAHAYTVGSDIVFGADRYAPSTASGQHLLAHELTHVVQQGGASAAVQRAGGDLDQRLRQAEEDWWLTYEELIAEGDNYNAAFAYRVIILLETVPDGDTFPNEDALNAFISKAEDDADSEETIIARTGEWAVESYTEAFPETWASRVHDLLTLGFGVMEVMADWLKQREKLSQEAVTLPSGIYLHGLPVAFEQRHHRLPGFMLRISDAASKNPSPVRDFAQHGVLFTQATFVTGFAIGWEAAVTEITGKIASGNLIVNYDDYLDFSDNKADILDQLAEYARGRMATSQEELQDAETRVMALKDAALVAGEWSAVGALIGILAGWAQASQLFDEALLQADGYVATGGEGEHFVSALAWAIENGYFGGAAWEMARAMWEQKAETLAGLAVILIAGSIPPLDIAVGVYLLLTTARDVIELLDQLVTAIRGVLNAKDVGHLQLSSADLAEVLTAGAIQILMVLVTEGIAKIVGKVKARAKQIKETHPEISDKIAEERAFEELSEQEKAPLEAGPAKVVEKFEETLGESCELASIVCRIKLPARVESEAGPYPKKHGVPMPKGPFRVQKAALVGVDRNPQLLRDLVLSKPRGTFPEFDLAWDAAGGKWPVDANGKAWEVHHIKPVFMGGDSVVDNVFPLPKAVHQEYSNWWNAVGRGFSKRFTETEWDLIYWNKKDVPGSRIPKNRKR